MNISDVERVWKYIEKTPTCWNWTGYSNMGGYGRVKINYRMVLAHRFVYEFIVGPIPEGKQLDHLCRNRLCVNPYHLQVVTNRENILRGVGICAENSRKTHCKRGHSLTSDNLTTYDIVTNGRRRCKRCQSETQHRYYLRKNVPVG